MASGRTVVPPAGGGAEPRLVVARLERIPIWSLPSLFVVVIGVGFLFTFFDIFDINVSFIQTCGQIVTHCTPANSGQFLGWPVLLNLVGYVVGTLALSPLADRWGRRDLLLVTMAITGLGSLWTAFTNDLTTFTLARFVTGIGIGADLAIVNTYINEVAPTRGRARYTSLIFIMSALGAFAGIWLGLLLTTAPTPFPLGLPFALAGPTFVAGWRVMYGIGALLAVTGVLLRFQLPESPRWLLTRGRTVEAARVVGDMERRAARRVALPEPAAGAQVEVSSESGVRRNAFRAILGEPRYLRRLLLLLATWFIAYVTVYSYAAGYTTALVSLHFAPPEAGLIAAIGALGFILCAVVAFLFGERLERKRWLPLAAVVTLAGAVIVGVGGQNLATAFSGSIVIFFGFNLWVPMTYSWSTECFPTRARTTGFALVDGIGHVGGGVGILVIAPLIPVLGTLPALLLITAFMVVASVIAQFGVNTRGRSLVSVSP
ncbi:MAG: MFS transporter [Candidatus Dormiibacterota bacterium]